MNKPRNHPEAGFSLVELAVVLVVIGLIIAAVLKGQDLIESARLKKVMSQIHDYRIATTSFMDRYDALPGDFNRASKQISPQLKDGEGTGILSGEGLQRGSPSLNFWSHLSYAKLITPPGKLSELDTPQFGKGAPSTPLGGGVTVEYNPEDTLPGLWFIVGNAHGNSGKGALFTPQQALSIVKKMDSAEPMAGKVQARNGQNSNAPRCITSQGDFETSHEQAACVLYFQL